MNRRQKELIDNLPPFVRHSIKWATMRKYRKSTPLLRTSYKTVHSDFLEKEMRKMNARLRVCELGAFSIESLDVGVQRLMEYDFCDLVLVEPQREEARRLRAFWEQKFGKNRVEILETVIGDGRDTEFRVCNDPSASAAIEPDLRIMNRYSRRDIEVVERFKAKSKSLDEALGDLTIDHLVMDIQGMELPTLKASPKTLASLPIVECEVEFQPLYQGQPMYEEVFTFMRAKGFEIFSFRKMVMGMGREFKARPSWNWYQWRSNFFEPRELIAGQPIFVRSDFNGYSGGYEKVLKAAFVLEKMYLSYDRAHRLLKEADVVFSKDNAQRYFHSLPDSIKSGLPSAE